MNIKLKVMTGYEIDFIPVGVGEKNGDAIAIRITENGQTTIYVIDGGTKESGEALVAHIRKYYKTERVDYLISTHPDQDHISGLRVVLKELEVKELWMHKPWEHAEQIIDDILDGRVTEHSLSKRIRESVNMAVEVEAVAKNKNIVIREPFQGEKIGPYFEVLSPDKDWYNDLLKDFDKMPPSRSASVCESQAYSRSQSFIYEDWLTETLEGGETSARNESSVVLFGHLPCDKGAERVLFTGDAGIEALTRADRYASSQNYDLSQCNFVQMPHHGSRRNVSPSVLNKMLGQILSPNTPATKVAFVNTSKGCPDYPKRSVVNAFIRRGVEVIATNGSTICHRSGYPPRAGWQSAPALEWSSKVEK